MKNRSIQQKMMICFVIIALFSAAVGGLALYGLSRVTDNGQDMYTNGFKSSIARELSANLHEQRVEFRDLTAYPDRREEGLRRLEELDREFQENLNWLLDNAITSEGAELLTTIQVQYTGGYLSALRVFIDAVFASQDAADQQALSGGIAVASFSDELAQVQAEAQFLDGVVDSYCVFSDQQSDRLTRENAFVSRVFLILTGCLVLCAVLLALQLGRYNAKQIAKPLGTLVDAANKLAHGNIQINLKTDRGDEIGKLFEAFNAMIVGIQEQAHTMERLADGDYTVELPVRSQQDVVNIATNRMIETTNRMMGQLKVAAAEVAQVAEQIARSSQNLSAGASEQAASIEELSVTLYGIDEHSHNNADDALEARKAFQNANGLLEEAIRSMEEMLEAMQAIHHSSQDHHQGDQDNRRHRLPDQHPRAQRGGGGGAGRAARQGLCGGRRRGARPRLQIGCGGPRDRRPDRGQRREDPARKPHCRADRRQPPPGLGRRGGGL